MASKLRHRSDSSSTTGDHKLCTLCYHEVDVWVVSSCDHSMCLKCSVRLRVLCDTRECPVCRKHSDKVIVTEKSSSTFSTLSCQKMTEIRKHGLMFTDVSLMKHFDRLYAIYCSRCDFQPSFKNMRMLRDHIRKEHNLYMCDICVSNLKLFPHEHKLYTRDQLTRHRREGDPNDSSHRGHPMCQFCEERFLDKDALFFHLKDRHFWCHFCEADGKQDYYANYSQLQGHFKDHHYLCTEGPCRFEKFTSVFRTKLDLQAHKTKAHSHGLTKAEAKQLRHVEVGFVYKSNEGTTRSHANRQHYNKKKYDSSSHQYNESDITESREEQVKTLLASAAPVQTDDHLLSITDINLGVVSPLEMIPHDVPNDEVVLIEEVETKSDNKMLPLIKKSNNDQSIANHEWPSLLYGGDTVSCVDELVIVANVKPPPGFTLRDKVVNQPSNDEEILQIARRMLDGNEKKLNRFHNYLDLYHTGDITVDDYHIRCANLFGNSWNIFGCELIQALPDDTKRRELQSIFNKKDIPNGGRVRTPPGFSSSAGKSKKTKRPSNDVPAAAWGNVRSADGLVMSDKNFPSLQTASKMVDPVPTQSSWNHKVAMKCQ